MHSETIEKLIKLFSRFPTVGPRTAARFVFYLIKRPTEEIEELVKTIGELKSKIKICSFCFKPFEGESGLCSICSDSRRDKAIICIVEKEVDLDALEQTNQFNGLYFVLDSTVSFKKDVEKKALQGRLDKLIERIKKDKIKEVILALNPTVEGQNTILWLRRQLEPYKVKLTQLGQGLPMGGELEYADEETLSSAIDNRR